MFHTSRKYKPGLISLTYLVVVALCILLAGCDINISGPGIGTGSSGSGCQGNCTTGAGVQGVQVFVEPDAGEHPITDAITSAKKVCVVRDLPVDRPQRDSRTGRSGQQGSGCPCHARATSIWWGRLTSTHHGPAESSWGQSGGQQPQFCLDT